MLWREDRSKCRTFIEIRNSPDTIAAREAIEQLTGKYHIDELELRRCVRFFQVGQLAGSPQRWSDRLNMTRTEGRRVSHLLKGCARTLEEAQTLLSTDATRPANLRTLILVADNIEKLLKETDDRNPDWTVAPKRELTQLVWRKAGKPLDGLLADVIGAILRTPGYSAEDQRKFRDRHCRLEGTDTYLLPPGPDTIPLIND